MTRVPSAGAGAPMPRWPFGSLQPHTPGSRAGGVGAAKVRGMAAVAHTAEAPNNTNAPVAISGRTAPRMAYMLAGRGVSSQSAPLRRELA